MKLSAARTGLVIVLLLCVSAGQPRAEPARRIGWPVASHRMRLGAAGWRDPLIVGDTLEIVARRTLPLGCDGWSFAPPKDPLAALRTCTVHDPLAQRLGEQVRPAAVSLLAAPRPSTAEPTRFSRLVLGADLGAGMASSVAGAGLVTGLWGEKTAGYLMGAGAVLGALWGETIGSDNSALRIRVGMDDSQRRWDRTNSQRDDSPPSAR
jgi:hypothetical protein